MHRAPRVKKKVDGCRVVAINRECMKRRCAASHFWRVLSIIGDQPAIIASRGFSVPRGKGKGADEARFWSATGRASWSRNGLSLKRIKVQVNELEGGGESWIEIGVQGGS